MGKHIYALVDDIFFKSKIRAAAEHLGLDIKFLKSESEVKLSLEDTLPSMLVMDLEALRFDPFSVAEEIKQHERTRGLRLVGFFSHVRADLQRRAKHSGIDVVVPRSVFSSRLPELLSGKDP